MDAPLSKFFIFVKKQMGMYYVDRLPITYPT